MGRIACIVVADFPLAALVRANPAMRDAPLAAARTVAPHAELAAVSDRARRLGVRAGMTVGQARSIVPDLVVMADSPAAERAALDALAGAARSLSPLVEPGESGSVWLDLAGLSRLHGSETEIASELARRVARCGMECAVGIAANKEVARLAARCGGIRVIEPGMEREFLDWMPLDVLELDAGGGAGASDGLETTLARWGIRRLGELARLNPDAVATRLGRRGAELVRLARGEETGAPFAPRSAGETFVEEIALDYGIENLEALGFVMRPMVERLLKRLDRRGYGAGDLILSLGLAGGRSLARRVAIGAPSIEARACLTLVMLGLEAAPPDDVVESIRIEIEPRPARAAQSDLFAPPSPAPGRLESTVARLAALCGPDNVGALRPENSHRPEAVRLDRFAPQASARTASSTESADCAENVARLAMRALRPPLEVEVMLNGGRPEFVRGLNLGARVVSIAGPWRRDGEWWLPRRGFRRDYYELALADGGVYRVFCDRNSERWFVDGVYD
jgi:protein ImuB